ncbi:single-stranded DNA-binding protein [Streptomyces mirabilis]|uniref:Single-stranded DNA-binding protein n=1 Tax=Streptomyces mirabilis TaxID=68239 RepID=A0ABU3V7E4_9ACTN|nr:single-stranded DNA-binding protein [Streptomyces mirabilis]MDU9002089.1 single-stranded DNA-binding protein [Streptomyces mirabilis]
MVPGRARAALTKPGRASTARWCGSGETVGRRPTPAAGSTTCSTFTIASTPRVFDRERSEFVDGDPLFLRCSLWRQAGENAAQSLTRGMRVIVTGRLRQRTFDDKEGIRRTTVEIDAEEVAASLTHATAKVTKAYRQGVPSQGGPAPTARPVPDSPSAQSSPSPAPTEPHPF